MKNGLIVGMLSLLSTAVYGAPCVSGSLQSYTTLSAGCEIGIVNFSNFAQVPGLFGGTPIDLNFVQVTPTGAVSTPSLNFSLQNPNTAVGNELADLIFRFYVAGPNLAQASIALNGATATNFAAVTGILNVCSGSPYPGNSPSGCLGTEGGALAAVTSFDSMSIDSTQRFTGSTFFDVFTDLTLDGGGNGRASLTSATVAFTVVPEPSAGWLLLPGALAVIAKIRARRKR